MPRGTVNHGGRPGGSAAAPIPRPSWDYEWKINHRAYGDVDDMKRREEDRLRAAENRQRARETGQKVELGKAGAAWEHAAAVTSGTAPKGGKGFGKGGGGRGMGKGGKSMGRGGSSGYSSGYGGQKQGGYNSAGGGYNSGYGSSASSTGGSDNPWANFNPGGRNTTTPSNGWESNVRPAPVGRPGPVGGAPPSRAGFGGGGGSSSSTWNSNSGGRSAGWSPSNAGADNSSSGGGGGGLWAKYSPTTTSQAPPIVSSGSGSGGGGWNSGSSSTWDAKKEEEKGWGNSSWQAEAQSSTQNGSWDKWQASTPEPASAATPPPGQWGAPYAPETIHEEAASFDLHLAYQGIDDALLQQHLERLSAQSTPPSAACVIDLTGNSITDAGVAALVRVVREKGIQISQLRLQGNPLQEPLALVELLRDPEVGLDGGVMRALMLSPGTISCETFWRILEQVCMKSPRPALAIFLDNQLGHLEPVVAEVEKNTWGVKLQRVPTLPNQPPPQVTANEETDVVLFIDQVCVGI